MAQSRFNYICITESGNVRKIASQSIEDIINEKQDWNDKFVTIIRQDLFDNSSDYELTKWHD